jgi:hypothetical protein
MIKLIDYSGSFSGNYTYCDHFPGQQRNMILLMNHYSDDSFAEQILERVLSELINLDLESMPEEQIKPALENFFVEINWRIYSLFTQRHDLERGISLLLLVMEQSRTYAVQFGRYFMGELLEDSFSELGRKWQDLSVKSLSDIQLLGSRDMDIHVKIENFSLRENSYFIAIESKAAIKLQKLGLHSLSINEHLHQIKRKERFGYALLQNFRQSAHNTSPWLRRRRVNQTATIFLVLIILSAVYVYYGKNLLDELFSGLKFRGSEFTRNELKEQFFLLQEQAQDLLKELSRQDMNINIELFPRQVLKLDSDWQIETPIPISDIPLFDYRRIYLTGVHRVFAIDKRGSEIRWENKYQAKVEVLRLVDANRILVYLSDDRLLCLNRDNGEEIWQKDYQIARGDTWQSSLSQISLNQYRQLDDSVFLMNTGDKLSVAHVKTGELMAEYEHDRKIEFMSEYDQLEKCVYISAGNKLVKINIKVII